jgi:uncharacterized membrane protein
MIEIVKFLATFVGLAVVLTLAVLNRGLVMFTWSPFDAPVSVPVMMVVVGGVMFGFIWGLVMAWVFNARARADTRFLRAELKTARAALDTMEHQAAVAIGTSAPEKTKKWWKVFG